MHSQNTVGANESLYQFGPWFHTLSPNVQEFVKHGNELAEDILGSQLSEPTVYYKQPKRQIVFIRGIHYGYAYDSSFWPFYRPPVVHHHHHYYGHNQNRRREEDEEVNPLIRFIVGSIFVLIGGYAVWKVIETCKRVKETNKELKNLRVFKRNINNWKGQFPTSQHLPKIEKIERAVTSIYKNLKASYVLQIALMAGVVAGAALVVAGAIIGGPLAASLMIGGIAVCGASSLGLLIKWAVELGDRVYIREANIIRTAFKELEASPIIPADPSYSYNSGYGFGSTRPAYFQP